MPLPEFNQAGDLPVGVYPATISEIVSRFGGATRQRQKVTERLLRICEVVKAIGKTDHVIIYGSYVTVKASPRDVDVVLVMRNDFELQTCRAEFAVLFDHEEAEREFGASVFWARPAMLIEPLADFIAHWQLKRDGARRGIVDVQL